MLFIEERQRDDLIYFFNSGDYSSHKRHFDCQRSRSLLYAAVAQQPPLAAQQAAAQSALALPLFFRKSGDSVEQPPLMGETPAGAVHPPHRQPIPPLHRQSLPPLLLLLLPLLLLLLLLLQSILLLLLLRRCLPCLISPPPPPPPHPLRPMFMSIDCQSFLFSNPGLEHGEQGGGGDVPPGRKMYVPRGKMYVLFYMSNLIQ
jgi:hypothetical protein